MFELHFCTWLSPGLNSTTPRPPPWLYSRYEPYADMPNRGPLLARYCHWNIFKSCLESNGWCSFFLSSNPWCSPLVPPCFAQLSSLNSFICTKRQHLHSSDLYHWIKVLHVLFVPNPWCSPPISVPYQTSFSPFIFIDSNDWTRTDDLHICTTDLKIKYVHVALSLP